MVKEKDISIIKCLRNNSRSQLKEISESTGLPLTSVFDRIKKINPIIIKNTSLLNFNQIYFPITLIYGLKIQNVDNNGIIDFLSYNKNVNNIYRSSGVFNLIVEALFTSLKDANDFSEDLKKYDLIKMNEFQIIEEIKKEEFFT